MDFFSVGALSQGNNLSTAISDGDSRSQAVPGASQHSAIFSACPTSFHDDLLSFLAYVKTTQIPVFSVTKPDIRSVLGRGASFLVNGAEMPDSCVDELTGEISKEYHCSVQACPGAARDERCPWPGQANQPDV